MKSTSDPVRQAAQGQLVITPTGEKRIRLSDLKAASPDPDARYISLYDILHRKYELEGSDDQIIKLSPITLKTLAIIEERFPDAMSGKTASDTNELIELVTIIVNQDAPAGKPITADEVASMLTTAVIPLVTVLIRESLNPLSVAPVTPRAGTSVPTGSGSSTSSPRSSAGTKIRPPTRR